MPLPLAELSGDWGTRGDSWQCLIDFQPEGGPRAGTLSPLKSIRIPVAMVPEQSIPVPLPMGWMGSKAGHSCTLGQVQDVPKSGTEAADRGFINSIRRSFGLFIYPAANSL